MKNNIQMYMHCMQCLRELPSHACAAEWARLNVGVTPNGLQVWCVRHNVSVGALDFRGHEIVYEVTGDGDQPEERKDSPATATRTVERRQRRTH